MEPIKQCSNVEFDVIYDDGQRLHVSEGVLIGAEEDGSVIFHNGTGRAEVWFAAADAMLVALNACNALPAFVLNRLLDSVSFQTLKKLAEEIVRNIWIKTPATFRLGQLDMQQCAADMLDAAAEESIGQVATDILHYAADLVRAMEIPGGD